VIVLSIDTDQRKISLGHKQISENPWDVFEREYPVGKIITGKVVRIIEKGLIAELEHGVDGFVPGTLLSTSKIKNFAYCFPVGNELELMVIEFDKENKKIVLSAIAAIKTKNVQEIEKYIEEHKLEKVSVEDIQNAEGGKFDAADFKVFDDQIKKVETEEVISEAKTEPVVSVTEENAVEENTIKEVENEATEETQNSEETDK